MFLSMNSYDITYGRNFVPVFSERQLLLNEIRQGKAVNLDYFSAEIDVLPTHPQTGQRFTAIQFLEYIRLRITEFIETSLDTSFTPSEITGVNEASIWQSNNPIDAILHINISNNNGSVICSDYVTSVQVNNGDWRFFTIEVPWGLPQGWDGPHPVSGTREFGLAQNQNGTYTFYTRGVDRLESQVDFDRARTALSTNPFHEAHNVWTSFIAGIDSFVQQHNGVSTPMVPNLHRPDWKKVRDVLLGNKPVSDLRCD